MENVLRKSNVTEAIEEYSNTQEKSHTMEQIHSFPDYMLLHFM